MSGRKQQTRKRRSATSSAEARIRRERKGAFNFGRVVGFAEGRHPAAQPIAPPDETWEVLVLYEDDSERIVTVQAPTYMKAREAAMMPRHHPECRLPIAARLVRSSSSPNPHCRLVRVRVSLREAIEIITRALIAAGKLDLGRARVEFEMTEDGVRLGFSQWQDCIKECAK